MKSALALQLQKVSIAISNGLEKFKIETIEKGKSSSLESITIKSSLPGNVRVDLIP